MNVKGSKFKVLINKSIESLLILRNDVIKKITEITFIINNKNGNYSINKINNPKTII